MAITVVNMMNSYVSVFFHVLHITVSQDGAELVPHILPTVGRRLRDLRAMEEVPKRVVCQLGI